MRGARLAAGLLLAAGGAAGGDPLPPTWSWPDLQRTTYRLWIERCVHPCPTPPLLGRGYMYLDYTFDKSPEKNKPRWFFNDVYDPETLNEETPQMFDCVVGMDGNYTYLAMVHGQPICTGIPFPWFPQKLTLKKVPQPVQTTYPLPPKSVIAYEVSFEPTGNNRLEVYLDPDLDLALWGIRWFSNLKGAYGNQSMVMTQEERPTSIPPAVFSQELVVPRNCVRPPPPPQ
eukprot:TRINITY_DN5153_c0_g1_i1.p2 TRINITY_DN5153_c0_g1~~TRINITY_DN5153_c0_g1_i1.p2  ORF type:complete len:254 (+),score=103.75 TRINITY_DN5153_c0_g1_i1:78-764(+)